MATDEQIQQVVDEGVAVLKDPLAEVGRLNLEVARLEGKLAAKDAALRQVDEASQGVLGEIGDCPDYKTAFRATEKCCGALQFMGDRAHAALSDTGEGRLPPEVREQAGERLRRASISWHNQLRHQGDYGCCPASECMDDRAALDALKEKP